MEGERWTEEGKLEMEEKGEAGKEEERRWPGEERR